MFGDLKKTGIANFTLMIFVSYSWYGRFFLEHCLVSAWTFWSVSKKAQPKQSLTTVNRQYNSRVELR